MGGYTNRIVVITGGTSGSGLASARQFIKEGATVVVIGRSSQNKTVNFTTTQPILPAPGSYLHVKITKTFPNSLLGEAVV